MAPSQKLRSDAMQIWRAGVEAVTPLRLMQDKVHVAGTRILVEGGNAEAVELELANTRRLVVVGAGKAGAAMTIAFKRVVLDRIVKALPGLEICGWINAPQDTFSSADALQMEPIHLHAARPPGVNSPTEDGIRGTQRILDLVSSCDQRDCVICLLSGGGSALLVAPESGVTLADKQAVAQQISAAGGNIEQLNAVRRPLSRVKGGGLARACRAGELITLVLSDVLGDPLETIASGPTFAYPLEVSKQVHLQSTSSRALAVLEELGLCQSPTLANVIRVLHQQIQAFAPSVVRHDNRPPHIQHVILGNNADAVDAAGVKAVELGYRYLMQSAQHSEGDVLQVACAAADAIEQLVAQDQIDCWISGGEPTVTLPMYGAGRGGRNQQLALATLCQLQSRHSTVFKQNTRREAVFVSGGTDGEDGPTDAAGALVDQAVVDCATELMLDASKYLAQADAYSYFSQVGGLIHTGPTGTNVCDIRVALCGQSGAVSPD